MKFGIQYQLNVVRPLDSEDWDPGDEHKRFKEALEQIEFADKLGFDYVFETEHHFLEEYSASSAPEVFLAAASQRTKNVRLGHGIVQMPPKQNHPARVAERIATLDLVSDGRVEFGTGEGATMTEIGGFGTEREDKKEAWEEATRECLRMMTDDAVSRLRGRSTSACRSATSCPSRCRSRTRRCGSPPAASRPSWSARAWAWARWASASRRRRRPQERVSRYYELIRNCRFPIGMAINPALASGRQHDDGARRTKRR